MRPTDAIAAPVECCPGERVRLVEPMFESRGVQRARLACCGCGSTLVFTVTLRRETPSQHLKAVS